MANCPMILKIGFKLPDDTSTWYLVPGTRYVGNFPDMK